MLYSFLRELLTDLFCAMAGMGISDGISGKMYPRECWLAGKSMFKSKPNLFSILNKNDLK